MSKLQKDCIIKEFEHSKFYGVPFKPESLLQKYIIQRVFATDLDPNNARMYIHVLTHCYTLPRNL